MISIDFFHIQIRLFSNSRRITLCRQYLERPRRVADATPQRTDINKKRKIVPLDDMGIIDTSLGATLSMEV